MITSAGVAVPEDMASALDADSTVAQAFAALRPGEQREFVQWLDKPGAQTRDQRLAELAQHVRNFRPRAAAD
jgi:uncharacterized protein YdeI (YjbR/CyaY-like superfamily)